MKAILPIYRHFRGGIHGGLLLCTLFIITGPLRAQDTLHTHTLRPAEVQAQRLVPTPTLTPHQQLRGAALQQVSTLSVADALRFFTGLQIKDYGGIGGLKTLNVRSMGSQHTAVFYDGIALGNAQNGTIDLGRFSLENIEAITLYNGQRTSTLQAASDYAAAGSVYLQSRMPQLGAQSDRWQFGLRGGSFGTVSPSALWQHRLSSQLSLSANIEGLYTTGRYPFTYTMRHADGTLANDTTATRRNGGVQAMRAEIGLYATGPYPWRIKAYLYSSARGLPGAMVRGRLRHADQQWDTNAFVQGTWQHTRGPWSLGVKGKYAYDYLHYLSDPRKEEGVMYVNNHYHQHEGYAALTLRWQPSLRWQLSWANDYRLNSLAADLYAFVEPTRHTWLSALALTYTQPQFSVQASTLMHSIHDQVRHGHGAHTQRLTPFLALRWQPLREVPWQWHAYYKSSLRMPTLNDLYYTFIGNAFLLPEEAVQLHLGTSYQHPLRVQHEVQGWWQVEASTYHNNIRNKIVAVPAANQFRWTMQNLGRVHILGVEASLSVQLQWQHQQARLRVSYTYQQAQDVTSASDSYYRDQIAYIPLHSGTATAAYHWRHWWIQYSFLYTGTRYDQQANIPENFVPAWYTSDMAVGTSWQWGERKVRLAASLNNLFDQAYEVVKSYPMPGRNYRLSLALDL